ncbi:MAG TPA: patatin-like phospholipase family protein [Micromonosporaceae bacterium]
MTTAWILPGGASFGAIQVGVATALVEHGLRPDMIIGTSIGAVNAAVLAGDMTPRGTDRLRDLWLRTRRRDVLALRPSTIAQGLIGQRNHLLGNEALGRWLRRVMPVELIEDAPVRLVVTASDLAAAEGVHLQHGDLATALLASCAVPGLLPPVRVADRWLVDGWVLANAPIGWAAEQGADTIYVLPCGGTQAFTGRATSPVLRRIAPDIRSRARTLLEHGLPAGASAINQELVGALVARRIRDEFQTWTSRRDIYLPPAPDVAAMSMLSFAEAPALIDAAGRLTRDWIANARPLTPEDVARPRALAGVDD